MTETRRQAEQAWAGVPFAIKASRPRQAWIPARRAFDAILARIRSRRVTNFDFTPIPGASGLVITSRAEKMTGTAPLRAIPRPHKPHPEQLFMVREPSPPDLFARILDWALMVSEGHPDRRMQE